MKFNRSARRMTDTIMSERRRFRAEVLSGLRKYPKELPSKYFYDEKGAHLFELICRLDEYYIPRIEAGIMNRCVNEIAELAGPDVFLIEYGSGNCNKVRLLLDNLLKPVAYVPIDISRTQLLGASQRLTSEYPELEILPVCADYTCGFELPVPQRPCRRKMIYFPGSTISNFDPIPAKRFLESAAHACGEDGALLIGVDLKKDPCVLHKAYNDPGGVTAAFNLNLLERINSELGSNFDISAFQHYAFYNPKESRIEMHLVSLKDQAVYLDGTVVTLEKGESIWTESSYKFNLEEMEQLAATAGFRVERVWTDEQQWFSVQLLVTSQTE